MGNRSTKELDKKYKSSFLGEFNPETPIKCQDSKDQEAYISTLGKELEKIGITEDDVREEYTIAEELTINGLPCEIYFNKGWYCGYVKLDPNNEKYSKNKRYHLLFSDTENSIDYIPHGGFTSLLGFDCHHWNDAVLNLWLVGMDPGIHQKATFKTKEFVVSELRHTTEAINKFLYR